jgi:hypothetical protein
MAENAENLLLFQHVSEFKGQYPEVPIPEELYQGIREADDDPFFVTLPIGKVGGYSQNRKREYSRREVEQIVKQVNEKRPEGRVGHVSMPDRAKTLPAMQWLGALIAEDGIAWGKAYVHRHAPDLRQHVKVMAVTNARVGTSIYGNAEDGEDGQWQNIDIQAIDVSGHPEAISVQDLQSVPHITAETINTGDDNQMSEEQTALIKEITNAKEELRVTLSETQTELKAVTSQRDELLEVKESLDELLALLGDEPKNKIEELFNREKALAVIETAFEDGADIWSRVDVVDADVPAIIEQVARKIEELQNKSLNDDIRQAIEADVELEALRPFATKHVNMLVRLGEVSDLESAKKAIAEFLADEDTQKIAQSLVSELAGGPVVAGTHVPDNTIRMPTAEEIAAARVNTGI